jgi:hypothetical protein
VDNVIIKLKKPLSNEIALKLVNFFDGANYCLGNSWTRTPEEEKKISERIIEMVNSKKAINLNGVDHTEGNVPTLLNISIDRGTIEVDRDWNAQYIEEILKEEKAEYELTDFYSQHKEFLGGRNRIDFYRQYDKEHPPKSDAEFWEWYDKNIRNDEYHRRK